MVVCVLIALNLVRKTVHRNFSTAPVRNIHFEILDLKSSDLVKFSYKKVCSKMHVPIIKSRFYRERNETHKSLDY